LKYQLRHAFFCHGITTDAEAETTTPIIRTIAQSESPTRIQVLVAILGPPNASDTATLGVLMPDGKSTMVGPEDFHLNSEGRAILVFQLHAIPLTTLGVVSAQVLFAGENEATPVCELRIVSPPPKGKSIDGSTLH